MEADVSIPIDTRAALEREPLKVVGRYAVYDEIASGGMARVHLGRMLGPVGFARTVAIKRLHPQFAKDPEFVTMFLDEARIAARIQHPNVVTTLDVVAESGELFLVMEYVQGESLSRLLRTCIKQQTPIPPPITSAILTAVLAGLQCAHAATNEHGIALGLVHRDISPQNVLVGQDGVSRVLDFGVAKAAGRSQASRTGQVKGKIAYMAPEQVRGNACCQSDLFAVAILAWEMTTLRRLFVSDSDATTMYRILTAPIEVPSSIFPSAGVFDDVIMQGLERDLTKRFGTAREMALALERAVRPASAAEVSAWVESMAPANPGHARPTHRRNRDRFHSVSPLIQHKDPLRTGTTAGVPRRSRDGNRRRASIFGPKASPRTDTPAVSSYRLGRWLAVHHCDRRADRLGHEDGSRRTRVGNSHAQFSRLRAARRPDLVRFRSSRGPRRIRLRQHERLTERGPCAKPDPYTDPKAPCVPPSQHGTVQSALSPAPQWYQEVEAECVGK